MIVRVAYGEVGDGLEAAFLLYKAFDSVRRSA
jgi:hypothetical protein